MRTAFCVLTVVVIASAADAATCESLSSLALPNTAVTTAREVAAGSFTPPVGRQGGRYGNAFAALPALCRVAVTLKPTSRSDIKSEVWLPTRGWNGKLQVVGNGSFAGTVPYSAMASALAAGYAAAERRERRALRRSHAEFAESRGSSDV